MKTTGMWRSVIDQIAAEGKLTEDWREPFLAVSREIFVPDTIWLDAPNGKGFLPLHKADNPDGWLRAVYQNEAVITQVNDGEPIVGSRYGRGTSSSSSMPAVMAAMLKALDVREGMRVLEIGTGTGYNAALLAYRLGGERVTSIEIDPSIAEHARAALQRAGYQPTVITGDGAEGYPPGAPYDRVLATAAVSTVPYAWVEQAMPGGLIAAPFGTRYLNSSMIVLTVAGDGTASGNFQGNTVFMRLRGQRIGDYFPDLDDDSGAVEGVTELHPYWPCGDFDGCAFAVSVLLPECEKSIAYENEERTAYEVLVFHEESGSWATVAVTPDAEDYPVWQRGPRRLWDEVERAYDWWMEQNRPAYTQFGLTVTPTGQQVWLNEPTNPVPQLV